jgi:HAD superfamily hydrolase (TIGR01509 family)
VSEDAFDRIPWGELETIFFDAGNTLISIDFDWVCEELNARGLDCEPVELRRAEAAARPDVSAGLPARAENESLDTFTFYFELVLRNLAAGRDAGTDERHRLARDLTPVFRGPGQTQRLWSWVIPGVRETLAALAATGIELAVVSNSDGSVEASLVGQGLREHFGQVFDSQVVGLEKPDARFFEHALEVCGADPQRTLHVGDLYTVDVVGARSAGVHALLLDPFEDWGSVDCARLPDLPSLADKIMQTR